jgi:hypothetical protein
MSGFPENRRKRKLHPQRKMKENGSGDARGDLGTFGGAMICGVPVLRIPDAVRKYPNFLSWWREVGRLNPRDPQGWSSMSGPGVMLSRSEMIAPETWNSLPEEERQLIKRWAKTIPLRIMFD